ncbi:MAG: hypothetical protein JOZ73_09020 [Solirubrobacterales bacterium]|nr:hypothetical protein [Solirubrobacterales bacterium]
MSAGPTALLDVREQVLARSRAGDEIDKIEHDLIEPAPLVEDDKAALWLLAWSAAQTGAADTRGS